MKPAGRMFCILTPRFAGWMAPPSPEVGPAPLLPPPDFRVKHLMKIYFANSRLSILFRALLCEDRA